MGVYLENFAEKNQKFFKEVGRKKIKISQ